MKFGVQNVQTASTAKPIRMVICGAGGVGKTTFAAGAPKPVFICAEDGLAALGVPHFPLPERFADVLEMLSSLANDAHDFKTVVVDSLDWLETLVVKQVCDDANVQSLEDVGFGKLYAKIPGVWRQFLVALEKLQRTKSMNVVLVAHQTIKTFSNPEGLDYDRVDLKLMDSRSCKTSDLIREWSDICAFAVVETFVKDSDGKNKASTSGSRYLLTAASPVRGAKTRYAIPDRVALAWSALEAAVEASRPLTASDARREIDSRLGKLKELDRKEAEKYIQAAGDDPVKLNKTLNWMKGKLS